MSKLKSMVLAAALSTVAALPVASVQAEEVRVPVMSQADNRERMQLPRHGQTREAVRARFGDPSGTKGPVGDPPISQWFYEEFVVYFERDRVIHAVARPDHNR